MNFKNVKSMIRRTGKNISRWKRNRKQGKQYCKENNYVRTLQEGDCQQDDCPREVSDPTQYEEKHTDTGSDTHTEKLQPDSRVEKEGRTYRSFLNENAVLRIC